MRQSLKEKILPKAKMVARMKLGQFFSLSEEQFSHYIKDIEKNPLFQELLHEYKVIGYKGFRDIQKPGVVEFKEELTSGESFDLNDLLEEDPKTWTIVRKVAVQLGKEKFLDFLHGGQMSLKQIEQICHLSKREGKSFIDFINRFQLREAFASPTPSSPAKSRTFKVAYIEKKGEGLIIVPLQNSNYLIKGRYVINYQKWEKFLQEKEIPADRIDGVSSLFRKLELINRRVSTLYQVIYYIKEIQHSFFISTDPRALVPLTQKEIAQRIGVSPSTVSRAINNKSLVTPQGEERPIKFFFCRERIGRFLLQILQDEEKELSQGTLSRPLSDDMIGRRLKDEYDIKVARRTVSKYRNKLKIPSSSKRKR